MIREDEVLQFSRNIYTYLTLFVKTSLLVIAATSVDTTSCILCTTVPTICQDDNGIDSWDMILGQLLQEAKSLS